MLTIPILAITAFMDIRQDTVYDLFVVNFLILLAFWVSLTNQIHKWSHTYHCPKFVTLLQDLGLILSKRDHAVHHKTPFDRYVKLSFCEICIHYLIRLFFRYYCITNGWLNPWLAAIGFWRRLEEAITLLTGKLFDAK